MAAATRRRELACLALAATTLACAAGCETIPPDSYGVGRIRFEGVNHMDEAALRACLATRERAHFGINLGTTSDPTCGVPPFDAGRLHWRWWPWPWSDWPTYDRAVFDRDLDRIVRWYRARGYYEAEVVETRFEPEQAAESDQTTDGGRRLCEEEDDGEGCRLEIEVTVDEGEPVLVRSVRVSGVEDLDRRAQDDVTRGVRLEVGDRWDEADHDEGKRRMLDRLRERGYACAEVLGNVEVNPSEHVADVRYTVNEGPRARLGRVEVRIPEADADRRLSRARILAASGLRPGDRYRQSVLEDARREVYSLGGLGSVEIVATPRRSDEETCDEVRDGDESYGVVDVEIRVTAGRQIRYGLGGGIETGDTNAGVDDTIRQWNLHLLAFVEHRNLFGGFRRLRIQEKPKLIFQNQFPRLEQDDSGSTLPPRLGNELTLEFRQPGFIEPRTELLYTGTWEVGPDPDFGRFRHDVDTGFRLGRSFWRNRISLRAGIHANLLRLLRSETAAAAATVSISEYHVLFWQQSLVLDLRDNPVQPRRGAYVSFDIDEAGFGLPASWDYVRMAPEARGYVPLPLGMVLAARFGLGLMFVSSADDALDPISQQLGPSRYRIRGGGANSHRGFVAGGLGDGTGAGPDGTNYLVNAGGLRRWLGTLELRMPMTESLGAVVFTDLGDVNREPAFRFDHINAAVGVGLRYQTIVGPVRFDIGWLVPRGRIVGQDDPPAISEVNFGFVKFSGAIHLTIGEAF